MPQAVYTPLNADEEQKPADDKINGLLEHLKSDIEAKLGKLHLLKAIHYYSRAHGAPIHYVKVQVADEKFAHITIMEPRFGKTGNSYIF